jgi:hypothetical protein
MPEEESKNLYRVRKKEPSTCAEGTYRVKKIKEGVEITICKDKDCVEKQGVSKCPTEAQNIMYSKQLYTKDAKGNIVPKSSRN